MVDMFDKNLVKGPSVFVPEGKRCLHVLIRIEWLMPGKIGATVLFSGAAILRLRSSSFVTTFIIAGVVAVGVVPAIV